MALVEEVTKVHGGRLFGMHTGREYEKSEVEKRDDGLWSKPCGWAPGVVNLELEELEGEDK
jgi:hypothetical protein